MNRTLILTIKKEWFDLIKSGKKKIEYREYKEYWKKRLLNKSYDFIEFRNGYRKNVPTVKAVYEGYVVIDGDITPLGNIKQFAIYIGDLVEENE